MKSRTAVFSLRMAGVAAILLLTSLGALSQDAAAPATATDGSKAQAVLGLQIDHVTVSVANIQAESDWYISRLGFTLPAPVQKMMGGKMQAEKLKTPGFQLDLIQYEGSERPKPPSPIFMQQGLVHIAFSVLDTGTAYNFLQAAGTDVKGNRNKDGKMGNLVLHDPEGNEIEIFGR